MVFVYIGVTFNCIHWTSQFYIAYMMLLGNDVKKYTMLIA